MSELEMEIHRPSQSCMAPEPGIAGSGSVDRIPGLESEVERLQRLATVGTLTAIVAHEINNCLTPVICYAQMLKSKQLDLGNADRAVDRILSGVEGASKVVGAILALTRESGVSRDTQRADIKSCILNALNCLGGAESTKFIVLNISTDSCFVRMDPILLQHVVLNLLLNAKRAIRDHDAKITVRTEHTTNIFRNISEPNKGMVVSSNKSLETATAYVQITIADQGHGIPPDIMESLFKPSGVASAGLGLQMCDRAVTAAGGVIQIASTVGVGTTVQVILPQAQEVDYSGG